MTKHFLVGTLFAAMIAMTGPAAAQDGTGVKKMARDIPCTCRFKGRDIALGETMCLDLPGGDVLAVCDRVLNNTAWKTLQKGCPVPGMTHAAPNMVLSLG